MPGTAGAAVGVMIGAVSYSLGGVGALVWATLLAIAAGFWATRQVEDAHDPPQVVIDEVAGQLIALLPIPFLLHVSPALEAMSLPVWLLAFVLFRLFDIWKPGIIGKVDRSQRKGAVMFDDLLAGGFAAATLAAVGGIFVLSAG